MFWLSALLRLEFSGAVTLLLCLYSLVIQPVRRGNASEMEMMERNFYSSCKKKSVLGNAVLVQRTLFLKGT